MQTVKLEVESCKFANLSDRVEVFDANGNLLGQFMPADERFTYVRFEVPQFTEEDRLRAEKDIREGRTYTTEQVLNYLRSLENA